MDQQQQLIHDVPMASMVIVMMMMMMMGSDRLWALGRKGPCARHLHTCTEKRVVA